MQFFFKKNFEPQRVNVVYQCGQLIQTSHVACIVCVSVCLLDTRVSLKKWLNQSRCRLRA